MISSWLDYGRNRINGACFSVPKRPRNQFKPVQQSKQQELINYCPNIYFDEHSKISHTVQLWQLCDIAPHHMGKEMKVPLNEVLHGKLTFFDMAKNLQTICSAVGQQKKLLLLHNLCLKMKTETFLDGFSSNLKIWCEKKSLWQLNQLLYKKYGPFLVNLTFWIFLQQFEYLWSTQNSWTFLG